MIISHIVAVAKNGVIGKDGRMPWHVEGELSRFRRLTIGNTVLMGRYTYQGLPQKLDGRKLIILSKTMPKQPDLIVARSLDEALDMAADCEELFIAGGGQVYLSTLDIINKVYLTEIDLDVDGDTYYPIDHLKDYQCIFSETHITNAKYTYKTYVKAERKSEISRLRSK